MLSWITFGVMNVAAFDEKRQGGATGAALLQNFFPWTGDVSRYGQIGIDYTITVTPGTIVAGRWECRSRNGPIAYFQTQAYASHSWTVSGQGGPAADSPDGSAIVLTDQDTYCAYHLWTISGPGGGGFSIPQPSTVYFWLSEFQGPGSGGGGGGATAPPPGSSASPGATLTAPPSSPPPATCNVWLPIGFTGPLGTHYDGYYLNQCAWSGSAADGAQFGAGTDTPALPTITGASKSLYAHRVAASTGGCGNPGYWSPVGRKNGTGSYSAAFGGAAFCNSTPWQMIWTQSSLAIGDTIAIKGQCGFGACSGGVADGGDAVNGGMTFYWVQTIESSAYPWNSSPSPSATPTPTPTPASSPTPSPTPTPIPPTGGGGFMFPTFPPPSRGPNLGGSEGYEEPTPPNPNRTGIAACDMDDGSYTKVGQAPLQALNDTTFPGSINPLDYIPWIGRMFTNVPIVIGNAVQTAVNTGVDFVVPGDCIPGIIDERVTEMRAAPPFSYIEEIGLAMQGSAGGSLPAIPLPGGGSVAFPTAQLAAAGSSVRPILAAFVWLAAAMTIGRIVLRTFGVGGSGGGD
jgi:hypothetical protein